MSNWEMVNRYLNSAKIVDLSPTIEPGMPRWPTHPQIIVDPGITHEHDGYYCQTLVLGEHTGAHVDCPAHKVPALMHKTVETYPATMLLGPAIKYDLFKLDPKPGEVVTKEQILGLEKEMDDAAKEGDIVLLNFGWQKYWRSDSEWKYFALNEPGLSEDACALFAERRVKAVGSDTAACDTPVKDGVEGGAPGHMIHWLPNDIFIMEMIMNMDQLPVRSYFMAIPLKIKNGSGSPIRPFAIVD